MTNAATLARRRRRPRLLVTAAAAACAFLVVLTLLAAQLRAGQDPALGTVARAAPAGQIAAPAGGRSTHTIVTRTSGGAVAASAPAAHVTPATSHVVSAPVTKSSGG